MDNKEEKPKKSEKESVKPIEAKEPEEPTLLIGLDVYCGSLDQSGIDKFAQPRIQSEINTGKVPAGDKTREEWEAIYLNLKNS